MILITKDFKNSHEIVTEKFQKKKKKIKDNMEETSLEMLLTNPERDKKNI